MQIDGVELFNDFFSGFYVQIYCNYVDLDIVKCVEIFCGLVLVLYGSNVIGGVVSYFIFDLLDIIKDGKDVGVWLKVGYELVSYFWLILVIVVGCVDDFDGLLYYGYCQGYEIEFNGGYGGIGFLCSEVNLEDVDSYSLFGKLGWNYVEGSCFGLVFEKYKSDVDIDQKSVYGGLYDKGKLVILLSMLLGGMYQWCKGNDILICECYGLEYYFLFDSLVVDCIQWSLNYQLVKIDQVICEFYYLIICKVLCICDIIYKECLWVFDSQLDKSFVIGEIEYLLSYGINFKYQKVIGMCSGIGINLDIGVDSLCDVLECSSDFFDLMVKIYVLFVQDSISWNDWIFIFGLCYDYMCMELYIIDEFLCIMKQSQNIVVDELDKKWYWVLFKFGVIYDFVQYYIWYG